MSQLEMQELKDFLNSPTALKFKKILENLRTNNLNNISHSYLDCNNAFNRDIILATLGGCETLEKLSVFFGNKENNELETLLEIFNGGK